MDKDFVNWISLCLRAPSGDNCQPWVIDYFKTHFSITIDEGLAQHYLDQNNIASWISVGCLCENLKQSASSFGYECSFSIEFSRTVRVDFHRTIKIEKTLILNSIFNRNTIRGKLLNVDIDISKLNKELETLTAGFEWKTKGEISQDLLAKWSKLEALVWTRTSLMKDFTRWLRLRRKNQIDGLTLSNLMLNAFDRLSIIVFKLIPVLVRLVPFFIFYLQVKKRLNFLLTNSSGIIYLVGKVQSYSDFFLVGMEIQKLWLFFTRMGVHAQPLTIQSLFLSCIELQSNFKHLNEREVKEIYNIKSRTLSELEVDSNILFMFRYGRSLELIDLLPRKNFDQVVRFRAKDEGIVSYT